MSLMPTGPSWANCTSNIAGTPSTAIGTAVPTTGVANDDSTPVALLTNVDHDVEMLAIGISGYVYSANDVRALVDIVVDRAGGSSFDTTNIPIEHLLAGHTAAAGAAIAVPLWYYFPLWFPAGCSFGARVRSSYAGVVTGRVTLNVFGGNRNPGSWWCGQSVESLGITEASSAGTAHTPGASGNFSSWANVGAAQNGPSGAVQYGYQFAAGTQTALQYIWEFGVAGNRIGPPIQYMGATSESQALTPTGPIFTQQEDGAQWQTHAKCSSTNAGTHHAAVYVVH